MLCKRYSAAACAFSRVALAPIGSDNCPQNERNPISQAQYEATTRLLSKICTNIAQSPEKLKFRRIKLSSKAVRERLVAAPAAMAFLRATGFAEKDGYLVHPGGANTTRVFNDAGAVLARAPPYQDAATVSSFSARATVTKPKITSSTRSSAAASPASASAIRHNNSAPFPGLINSGATCFLNSILQVYFYNSEFRRIVFAAPFREGSILHGIQDLFFRLASGGTKPVSTRHLTSCFGWTGGDLLRQQDAHELNRILIDRVESELENTCPSLAISLRSLLTGVIAPYTRTIDSPLNAHESAARDEQFYDISLPIPTGGSDLESALSDYCAEQELEGGWKPTSTCKRMRAARGVRFRAFPPLFFIHFGRFAFDGATGRRVKVHGPMTYPETLNLKPLLSAEENKTSASENKISAGTYKLVGVVLHVGGATSGHYTSHVRVSKRWVKFDDSKVSFSAPKEVLKGSFGGGRRRASAYMLIYMSTESESNLPSVSEVPAELRQKLNASHRARTAKATEARSRARSTAVVYLWTPEGKALTRPGPGFLSLSGVKLDDMKKISVDPKKSLTKNRQDLAQAVGADASKMQLWALERTSRQGSTVSKTTVTDVAVTRLTEARERVPVGRLCGTSAALRLISLREPPPKLNASVSESSAVLLLLVQCLPSMTDVRYIGPLLVPRDGFMLDDLLAYGSRVCGSGGSASLGAYVDGFGGSSDPCVLGDDDTKNGILRSGAVVCFAHSTSRHESNDARHESNDARHESNDTKHDDHPVLAAWSRLRKTVEITCEPMLTPKQRRAQQPIKVRSGEPVVRLSLLRTTLIRDAGIALKSALRQLGAPPHLDLFAADPIRGGPKRTPADPTASLQTACTAMGVTLWKLFYTPGDTKSEEAESNEMELIPVQTRVLPVQWITKMMLPGPCYRLKVPLDPMPTIATATRLLEDAMGESSSGENGELWWFVTAKNAIVRRLRMDTPLSTLQTTLSGDWAPVRAQMALPKPDVDTTDMALVFVSQVRRSVGTNNSLIAFGTPFALWIRGDEKGEVVLSALRKSIVASAKPGTDTTACRLAVRVRSPRGKSRFSYIPIDSDKRISEVRKMQVGTQALDLVLTLAPNPQIPPFSDMTHNIGPPGVRPASSCVSHESAAHQCR